MFSLKSFRIQVVDSTEEKAYRVLQQFHQGQYISFYSIIIIITIGRARLLLEFKKNRYLVHN